jgi:hypothetical protein
MSQATDRELLFTTYNILRVRQTCWEAKAYIEQDSAANLPGMLHKRRDSVLVIQAVPFYVIGS